jgi:hypothetical protein
VITTPYTTSNKKEILFYVSLVKGALQVWSWLQEEAALLDEPQEMGTNTLHEGLYYSEFVKLLRVSLVLYLSKWTAKNGQVLAIG